MPNNLGYTPAGPEALGGSRYTTNEALKDVTRISRIIAPTPDVFLSTWLFRRATTESGAVIYNQARKNGAYPERGDAHIVAPAADFPLIDLGEEELATALAEKTGVGFRLTDESRERKQDDEVNRAFMIAGNTLRRQNARQAYQAFLDAGIPTTNAVAVWSDPDAADPRRDIRKAQASVRNRKLGYNPTSVLGNPTTLAELELNPLFVSWMPRENASLNPFLNQGINGFLSVNWVETSEMPEDEVIVLQPGMVGVDVVEKEVHTEAIRESGQKTLYQVARRNVPIITDPYAAIRVQGVLA